MQNHRLREFDMLIVSEAWQATYPGASQGVLVMRGIANPERHAELEKRKAEVEEQLRARFAGYDKPALAALPSVQPYVAYYAKFKKTYHVLLQLESVALKGKLLPRVAALVEAMFMAELKNQFLTAGHDLGALREPLRLDVATGDERYTLLNGKEETLKAGDMFIADAEGVTSSILYGPDHRTRITPETRNALFTVYAPPGIVPAAVRQHLEDIRAYVGLIAPGAEGVLLKVYGPG
jgi:DNA/RNA-binding domain of Phe-tRNA-synthetase-like protein